MPWMLTDPDPLEIRLAGHFGLPLEEVVAGSMHVDHAQYDGTQVVVWDQVVDEVRTQGSGEISWADWQRIQEECRCDAWQWFILGEGESPSQVSCGLMAGHLSRHEASRGDVTIQWPESRTYRG